jgi:hypothetical protein
VVDGEAGLGWAAVLAGPGVAGEDGAAGDLGQGLVEEGWVVGLAFLPTTVVMGGLSLGFSEKLIMRFGFSDLGVGGCGGVRGGIRTARMSRGKSRSMSGIEVASSLRKRLEEGLFSTGSMWRVADGQVYEESRCRCRRSSPRPRSCWRRASWSAAGWVVAGLRGSGMLWRGGEARVKSKNGDRGPLLIIDGEKGDEADDRSEDVLASGGVVVGYRGEDDGGEPVAVAVGGAAADRQRGVVGDEGGDRLALSGRDQRAHLGRLVEWVADHDPVDHGRHRGEEIVKEIPLHQDARARAAVLPGVVEGRLRCWGLRLRVV